MCVRVYLAIYLYIYAFLIYPSISGHLSSFQVFTVVNLQRTRECVYLFEIVILLPSARRAYLRDIAGPAADRRNKARVALNPSMYFSVSHCIFGFYQV